MNWAIGFVFIRYKFITLEIPEGGVHNSESAAKRYLEFMGKNPQTIIKCIIS